MRVEVVMAAAMAIMLTMRMIVTDSGDVFPDEEE